MPHLIVAPIVLPLVMAALMVLPGAKSTRVKGLLNIAAVLANLLVEHAAPLRARCHRCGA